MKQLGEVWRSCTRDNVEAGESYFVLNLAADRQLVNSTESRVVSSWILTERGWGGAI